MDTICSFLKIGQAIDIPAVVDDALHGLLPQNLSQCQMRLLPVSMKSFLQKKRTKKVSIQAPAHFIEQKRVYGKEVLIP